MFQTDLVRPGTRAWLVALALASWCAGAEPSNSPPSAPDPATSPGSASPGAPPPAMRPDTPPAPVSNSPSPTAIPARGRRSPRSRPSRRGPTPGPPAVPACSGRPTPPSPRRRCRSRRRSSRSPSGPGWNRPSATPGRQASCPREGQSDAHFVPVEDRWRIGYPEWDRYGKGHPVGNDYPYAPGRFLDPFNQNVLKGDYPIIGQHTFLDITALAILVPGVPPDPDGRPRRSRARRGRSRELLRPAQQYFTTNFFSLAFDLFHGDAAFKPVDWRIKLTPTFNVNNFSFSELGDRQPQRAPGDDADPRVLGAAGGVRRDQAGRPQPRLRLHLGPGRHPAVQHRLPRLPLRRHQPRRPALRHPQRQPRPVQPRLLPPVGEGHQQPAEHVQRPPAEPGLRQLLPPGLHLPRLHGPGQPALQQRPARRSSSTRTGSWSVPTRSASSSRTRSTSATSAGPATATSAGTT